MAKSDFVGRERELGVLNGHLESAHNGVATYVFISGEAGMGKARLVDEFISRLGKEVAVLGHRNVPKDRTVPFSALSAILRQCGKRRELCSESLETLLETMDSRSRGAGDLKRERDKLQAGIFEFFKRSSECRPIVIYLGDAQWLDESSVVMFQAMVRGLKKSRTLLIGTYSPDELEDAAGNPLPFTEALASMLIEGLVAMLPLEKLSQEETGRLAALRAGLRRPDAELTKMVFNESEGLPLLAMEIVDALVESGALRLGKSRKAGKLDMTGIKVPKGIGGTVKQRLDALPDAESRVLDVAAVLGASFEAELLRKTLGGPRRVADSALAGLVSRKLIYEVTGAKVETYRFVHAKVQQIAYDALGKGARKELHSKAASALLKLNPDVPEVVAYELCGHLAAADRHPEAAKYARISANYAANSHALEEALRYFMMAEAALAKLPKSKERGLAEAEVLMEAAAVQYSAGEWEAALERYARAADLGKKSNDVPIFISAINGIGDILRFKGDYERARASFERVISAVEKHRDERAKAVALKGIGYIDWRLGDFDSAEKRYADAHAIAKRLGDDSLLGAVALERGNVSTSRGDLAAAERGYLDAIKYAERLKDFFNLARAYNNLGDICLQRREWEGAISNFEMCAGIARSIGNHDILAWSLFNLGEALAKKGELDRAQSACEESLTMLAKLDDRTGIAGIYKNLGTINAKRGNWKKAAEFFAKSAKMEIEMNTPHALAETYIEWGDALRERGDSDGARAKLTEALEIARKIEARELEKKARTSLKATERMA